MILSHNGGWAQQHSLIQWKLYIQNWAQVIIEIMNKSCEHIAQISVSPIPAVWSLSFQLSHLALWRISYIQWIGEGKEILIKTHSYHKSIYLPFSLVFCQHTRIRECLPDSQIDHHNV